MHETIAAFTERLGSAWSPESSTRWRRDNPALGQCGVTTLVVQDVFGGTLLKTRVGPAWHFYNLIDGQRHDLTASQFSAPLSYDDVPATREEAFADTSPQQYRALRRSLALREATGAPLSPPSCP